MIRASNSFSYIVSNFERRRAIVYDISQGVGWLKFGGYD
jgi:hypothetical protein